VRTDPFNIIHSHRRESCSVVVAPGLNVRPEAMSEVIALLTQLGARVFVVKLSGHHEGGHSLSEVELKHWETEFLETYHHAQRFAEERNAPLHFVGYSMGCLLAQYMGLRRSIKFDKKVFLAPATNLSMASKLLSWLFFLPPRITLPSFTPRHIRANAKLPIKLYMLMFEMEGIVRDNRYQNLNTPTLIVADPKDELISFDQISRDKGQFQLSEFQILTLDSNLNGRDTRYHHLILTEANTGSVNWNLMKKKIGEFLF
jgi:esterase/lipase